MLLWLLVAILAYFLLALASLGDRFLLVGPLPSPKTYAFSIAALGILAVPFLLPFGFSLPAGSTILVSLAAGFLWIVALIFYFDAIAKSEVSRVVPAVGAFVPIFTILATSFLWREPLSQKEFLAFLVLVSGGFLITSPRLRLWAGFFLHDHVFSRILSAAFLFAASFLLMKTVFGKETFTNGFIWMRIGGALAAFLLLFSREVRSAFFVQKSAFQERTMLPLFFTQFAGGVGFVLQNVAIASAMRSQIPLINALEGLRYLFLFFFVWSAARWRPKLLQEEMQGVVLRQKIIAGMVIIFGVSLLAL